MKSRHRKAIVGKVHERLSAIVEDFLRNKPQGTQNVYRMRFRTLAAFSGYPPQAWLRALSDLVSNGEKVAHDRYVKYWRWLKSQGMGPQWVHNNSSGFRRLTTYMCREGLIGWELAKLSSRAARKDASKCHPEFHRHAMEWLSWLQEELRAENTVLQYQRALFAFGAFLGTRGAQLRLITPTCISDWITELRKKGFGAFAINGRLNSVRCFLRWLGRKGVVKRQVAASIENLRTPRILPRSLEESETNAVIEAAACPRARAVVEILYATGCRISELEALDVEDLDLSRQRVLIRESKREIRFLPLTRPATKAIHAYLGKRRLLLERKRMRGTRALFVNRFGRRLRCGTMRGDIRTLARLAGIRKRVSPKVFRDSLGAHLLDHGADLRFVQMLFGHGSIKTTSRYTDVAVSSLDTIYRRYHPRK